MNATAETIWRVPAYLPYLQPELTDDAIREAESHFGVRLPSAYLDLLRVQNGGYIRYHLPEMVHRQIYGIGPNFPSLLHCDWDEDQEYVSFDLQGLIPFDGDGHWHLCFDYRLNPSEPRIIYVDVECDRESLVASDFAEYLRQLIPAVDERSFVIPSVPAIEELTSRLGLFLGISFESPSSFDHGYPVFRARVPVPEPEWVWISPNLVPRAFVRESDGRYHELRHLRPGQAKRYVELPETSYLVTATEGVQHRLLEACRAESIEIHPIGDFFR